MSALPQLARRKILTHAVLVLVGLMLIWPLAWLVFASFKPNLEIFSSASLLPKEWSLEGYIEGWKGTGQYSFTTFTINTFIMVVPTVLLTVASCTLVAYGFARFHFAGKKFLFPLMLATLMLPDSVIIIPRYLIFRDLGLLDSYWPFYLPAMLACYPFFIYMLIQFMRGIPKELDESAKIDGCGTFGIFIRILVPLLKPAMFSAGLFQTMWVWNNFMNPLIYINDVAKYPYALGLRMCMDVDSAIPWNEILAMSMVTMLPLVLLFFFAQKYFVEGIATSGLKG